MPWHIDDCATVEQLSLIYNLSTLIFGILLCKMEHWRVKAGAKKRRLKGGTREFRLIIPITIQSFIFSLQTYRCFIHWTWCKEQSRHKELIKSCCRQRCWSERCAEIRISVELGRRKRKEAEILQYYLSIIHESITRLDTRSSLPNQVNLYE